MPSNFYYHLGSKYLTEFKIGQVTSIPRLMTLAQADRILGRRVDDSIWAVVDQKTRAR